MDIALTLAGLIIAAIGTYYTYKAFRATAPAGRRSSGTPSAGASRIAVAVVVDGSRVLMVRRQYNPERLTWQFPAGQMNPGESPEHRAEREVRSETGVQCRPEAIIGERNHPQTQVHCSYVRCSYISGTATNADPQENSEVAWVDAVEVAARVSTDLDGEVLRFLDTLNAERARD
ncbi:NUDIX hydrolase [Novispirillum sp. DQ9]|uniref:NUDIX hydrolase n=1 Tax=Novispirillum sp. DQ9 TaxID=3398612 RepID=UPI003C7D2B46